MNKSLNVESPEVNREEEKIKSCPDCGNEEIEHEGEEFYCKKCGLVID